MILQILSLKKCVYVYILNDFIHKYLLITEHHAPSQNTLQRAENQPEHPRIVASDNVKI